MKIENNEIDWLFSFCKSCWEYRKIVFSKKIDFSNDLELKGKCVQCNNINLFNIKKIQNYYMNLNKNNH